MFPRTIHRIICVNWCLLTLSNHDFESVFELEFAPLQVEERTEGKASSRGHRGGSEPRRDGKLPFQTTAQRPTQLSTFASMLTCMYTHVHSLISKAAHHGDTHGFWKYTCTAFDWAEIHYPSTHIAYSTYLHTFAHWRHWTRCHYLVAHTRDVFILLRHTHAFQPKDRNREGPK